MKFPTGPLERPHPQILLPHLLPDYQLEHLADFVETLRHKEGYCLGFIPAVAYPRAMRRGRLFIELENDEPVGFCMWARKNRQIKIHQTAIVEDARRIKHGTSIVTAVLNADVNRTATQLQLRVAEDLEANAFWRSIGCTVARVVNGGKTWGRKINVYRMPIEDKMAVAMRLIDANLAAHLRPEPIKGRRHPTKATREARIRERRRETMPGILSRPDRFSASEADAENPPTLTNGT